MKKTIAILLTWLSVLTASAYDYKTLVEQGKTWWYAAARYAHTPDEINETIGIRISGTETINGTEWSCCRVVDPDNRAEVLQPVIAYLREEGTKAYMLPVGSLDGIDKAKHKEILHDAYLRWTAMYTNYGDMPAGGYVFADFGVSAGQSYSLISSSLTFNATDVEYKTVSSIERKIVYAESNGTSHTFTDGIGQNGKESDALFFVIALDRPAGAMNDWTVGLTRVEDSKGNTLWTDNNAELVEQGKTWWYHSGNINMDCMFGLRICETAEVGGYEWHACRLVGDADRTTTIGPVVAYIRESGSKMYYYPGAESPEYDNAAYTEAIASAFGRHKDIRNVPPEGIEVCDFSAKENEFFYCFGRMVTQQDNEVFEPYRILVNSVDYATSCGIERRISCGRLYIGERPYGVSDYLTINGIGLTNTSLGGLFFVPMVYSTSSTTQIKTMLQGVVDADERLLWVADESITEPWKPAGISDAVADADATVWSFDGEALHFTADATLRVFDLSGRTVLAPVAVSAGEALRLDLPAGLYIAEATGSKGRYAARIALR